MAQRTVLKYSGVLFWNCGRTLVDPKPDDSTVGAPERLEWGKGVNLIL